MKYLPRLPLFPLLTVLFLLGPLVAGLWGTLLPAFGHFPAGGHTGPSLDPFRALWNWPGLSDASRLSLVTGVVSAVLSLAITALILAGWTGTRGFRVLERLLSPFLSVPHAAAAFGLAFLDCPLGLDFARLLSPWLTGWERPPDLLILNDPWGLSPNRRHGGERGPVPPPHVHRCPWPDRRTPPHGVKPEHGIRTHQAWMIAIFPALYARIRLPCLWS